MAHLPMSCKQSSSVYKPTLLCCVEQVCGWITSHARKQLSSPAICNHLHIVHQNWIQHHCTIAAMLQDYFTQTRVDNQTAAWASDNQTYLDALCGSAGEQHFGGSQASSAQSQTCCVRCPQGHCYLSEVGPQLLLRSRSPLQASGARLRLQVTLLQGHCTCSAPTFPAFLAASGSSSCRIVGRHLGGSCCMGVVA